MENRLLQRILLLCGLSVLALPGIRTISHSEFWTHLAAGRWIVGNGIPRTDPFSFIKADAAWIHTSWLYDVLLYGFWQIGAAPLVTFVHVMAVLTAFALLIPVARRWAGPFAIVLALILSAWLLAPRFEVRPITLAMVFPALFMFLLSGRFKPALHIPILLGAQLLWTQLHISFIAGPFFCLVFTAQAYAHGKGGLFEAGAFPPDRKRTFHQLMALTVATALISLANPYGFGLHLEAFRAFLNPVVSEWISPFSGHFLSRFARHMVTLTLIIGAGGLLTRKDKLPLAITTLAVVSAFLVVRSTANYIDLFALLAFPFFALSLDSIGRYGAETLFRKSSLQTRLPPVLTGFVILLTAASVFGIVSNRYFVRTGSASSFGWGTVTDLYPEAAAHIIERSDFPVRAINLPMDGGYLAWRFPDRKIFVDQRAPLFDFAFYANLAQGLSGRSDPWNTLMDEWEPGAVIINGTWPNAPDAIRHLRSQDRWELLYFDGATAILVLNVSEHLTLLRDKSEYLRTGLQLIEEERRDYRTRLGGFTRPPVPARLIGAANVFHHARRYPAAAALYELLTIGAPRMITAHIYLGLCHVQMGHYTSAIRTLEPAIRSLPKDSPLAGMAHLNIGMSRAQLEDYETALQDFRRAAELQPENPTVWIWMGRLFMEQGRRHDAESAFQRARQIDPTITIPD